MRTCARFACPQIALSIPWHAGVFTNVTSPSTKAKLRLLFEVAPLALLVEKAGGASSCDGKSVSGLDVPITDIDQRTQICYGSKGEVARFEQYLYGESPRFADLTPA
jgi:sedoheptulose-bisphosphatase